MWLVWREGSLFMVDTGIPTASRFALWYILAEHWNNSVAFILLLEEKTLGVCIEICSTDIIRYCLVWSTHRIPPHRDHHPCDYKQSIKQEEGLHFAQLKEVSSIACDHTAFG
jgi:hypothetical protein